MKVSCPSCRSTLNIDDKKIPASGARIKCPTCQNIFPVKPGSSAPLASPSSRTATVPLPGAAGTALVPLPGGSLDERTRVGPAGAVPLPGAAGRADERTVIAPATSSAPLPRAASADRARTAAVPLPGASQPEARSGATQQTSSIPLPGASFDETPPPRAASKPVPLPGSLADLTTRSSHKHLLIAHVRSSYARITSTLFYDTIHETLSSNTSHAQNDSSRVHPCVNIHDQLLRLRRLIECNAGSVSLN